MSVSPRETLFTPWRDMYHYLMRASWAVLVAALCAGFVLTNVAFALAYLACGDCIAAQDPSSFLLAFSFSVQTISTIGFGAMSPTTPAAHVLVAVEVFCGLLGIGMATGIIFQKFARPTARVRFSKWVVVAPRNGVPTLMFRLVNERTSHIVDLRLNVTVLLDEVSEEGHFMRRFHSLPLERSRSPVFAMSFTVMHAIDEHSLLYRMDDATFADRVVGFVVTVTGIDDTMAQPVHSQFFYEPEAVKFGYRFGDMILEDGGRLRIDIDRLDDTERLEG
ncbi:MAG: inward rectifier potassium channel [Myxococcota bacterium]|jgi:inward rectifier potassium channel